MTTDPDLVLETLRRIDAALLEHYRTGDYSLLGMRTQDAMQMHKPLPHAEAIAEMWPRMIEVEADGGTTQREHFADLVRREPAVQELIAAARPFANDINEDTSCTTGSPSWRPRLPRLRAALKPFEKEV